MCFLGSLAHGIQLAQTVFNGATYLWGGVNNEVVLRIACYQLSLP
jgi:hypothetical protein